MDFFIVMYLIGAYIRLYIKSIYSNRRKIFLCLVLSTLIMLLTVPVIDFIGKILKANVIINHATYFMKYNSIISVVWAVSVFLFFCTLKFKSNIVNYIAGSVLGIYLIHDNFILRQYIWQVIYPNSNYIEFPYIHAATKIFSVFAICLIIDILRRITIEKVFNSCLRNLF